MNKEIKNRQFPLIKKNRYYNNADDRPESFLFQTIPSFIRSLYGRKKRQPENKSEWLVLDTPLQQSKEPLITWIGHASFLIQVEGINILTDPIFGSPSAFFPRILPPGIELNQLPRIDYVVLSHNHRDHCDIKSLLALKKAHPNMVLLVPKGDKHWLEKKGIAPAVEHEWWQTYTHETYETPITFTFLPAHHWSAQTIFDRNKSLWGSWMININNKNIYFAGDTSYSNHFLGIGQEFPSISIALMPIAPEKPHPWMRKSHMDSQQAVQAFIDLNAHHFIPMHWGTFQFGRDIFHGPIESLKIAWNDSKLHENKKLTILKVGQRISL